MKIAILGGGLTGLCAALRLKESNLSENWEIVILEEKPYPGGLLQTTYQNGYWWDNGVFIFLGSNYLCHLLPDLFQPVTDVAIKAWIKGNTYNFPFAKGYLLRQAKFALFGTVFDYIYSYVRVKLGWDAANLHDWLRYRLTARFLEISQLETYISKLQGLPLTELSPKLGMLRLRNIHQFTRPGIMLRVIFSSPRKEKENAAKRDPDVYPSGFGVGEISRRLAELCQQKGVRIIDGARIKEVSRNDGTGLQIRYDGTSGQELYQADFAISTIPLEELAESCQPPLSAASRAYARQLAYMDLKVFFFLVKRPLISHKFFVLYSLEHGHPWKRLLCQAMPDGVNAVTVEVAFNPRTDRLDEGLEDIIVQQLTEELGLFEPGEILLRQSKHIRRAYPVYRLGFEEKLDTLLTELESERLRLAGRQGRFLYVSTPGAIQSAKEAADKIIQSITATATAASP